MAGELRTTGAPTHGHHDAHEHDHHRMDDDGAPSRRAHRRPGLVVDVQRLRAFMDAEELAECAGLLAQMDANRARYVHPNDEHCVTPEERAAILRALDRSVNAIPARDFTPAASKPLRGTATLGDFLPPGVVAIALDTEWHREREAR